MSRFIQQNTKPTPTRSVPQTPCPMCQGKEAAMELQHKGQDAKKTTPKKKNKK